MIKNIFFTVFFAIICLSSFAQSDRYIFHDVQAGETKYSISRQYNISIEELEKFNPEIKNGLRINSKLLIPKPKPDETAAGALKDFIIHKVEPGQTLYSIGRTYNISVPEIEQNNPEVKNGLKAGQELQIPRKARENEENPISNTTVADTQKGGHIIHKVTDGETLYSLSKRYEVEIADIKALNPDMQDGLKAGMELKIPNASGQNGEEEIKYDPQKLAKEIARAKYEREALGNNGAQKDYLAHLNGRFHLHKVEKEQTALNICKLYDISVDSLYLLNREIENGLLIGQWVRLPKNRAPVKPDAEEKPEEKLATDKVETVISEADTSGKYFLYKVKTGDSFYSLKSRYNVSQEDLESLNPELKRGLVLDKYIIIPKREKNVEDVKWLDKLFGNTEEGLPAQKPAESKQLEKDSLNRPNREADDIQQAAVVKEIPVKIDRNKDFQIGIMLPFKASTDTSFNYSTTVEASSVYVLDFYNGLLMAADTLAKQGMNISLNVYDTRNSIFTVKQKMPEFKRMNFDMVIGPLFQQPSEYMADHISDDVPVISPLSRTVDVEARPNLVKCIAGRDASIDQIAKMINANHYTSKVIFTFADSTDESRRVREIKARLLPRSKDSFIGHVYITEEVLQAENIEGDLKEDKGNVIVILSEDKVFLSNIVNKLRLLRSYNISLIGPPKMMEIQTLEMDYLNALNVTIPDVNFIDYSDPHTQHFIKQYREKYSAEPSRFAFQGYDVGVYFLKKLWQHGRPYLLQNLEDEGKLLSTGFQLYKIPNGGYQNHFMILTGMRDFTLVQIKE